MRSGKSSGPVGGEYHGDTLTPEQRSERMGRVRAKDSKPELLVRRVIHGLGYRYRLHVRSLPGIPDIVFTRRKKVIFVHGCFWHRHEGCSRCRLPKSKLDFWKPKLDQNRQRDAVNMARLADLGWQVLIIWECEATARPELAERITAFLEG